MSNVIHVLLIEGRARQVLPVSKALREMGCEVTTYNGSKLDPGYASKYPHRKLLAYCDAYDPEGTYQAIKSELEKYKYDIVIPMNDDVAIILSSHKKELEKLTTIHVEDWETFQMASDKLNTMLVCMEYGLPCPLSFTDKKDYLANKDKVKFPVVVKPRTGCAAVGFYVAQDKADLIGYYDRAEQKYGKMLIQEYITQDGLQYKCEMFIDRNGEMKGACVFSKVRWYPINGGSSTLNETVDRPDIVADCQKLLQEIGWKGYADIDLIEDTRDGKVKIMEINPRITGSVKICFEAGVNFAKMIVDDYLGKRVEPQFEVKHKYLRYIHTDVLWFLKSPNRFSCKPSWFCFKNTTDQIFSWADLWVFFAFTLQGFAKLSKDKKKRAI
ncbi:ATP-grasp domain-containing protein [uncultured Bacteroides sp.]|uniref:carboxylate--amine ligase n=1 Tax=uncultured Bacteroides sp. TaxID=162156 RepID=UPI0025F476B9|nr:ATP-grasp domain-containing protein [uncultured Bacteroides sp.]